MTAPDQAGGVHGQAIGFRLAPGTVENQHCQSGLLLVVEAVARTLGPILSAALVVAPLVMCPPCVTV